MTTIRAAAALLVLPFAVACGAPDTTEQSGESTSHLENGGDSSDDSSSNDVPYTCSGSITNPSCDAGFFLTNAWNLAQTDPLNVTIDHASSAGACISQLVALGVVAYGSGGTVPVALTVGGVWSGIQNATACVDTAEYLNQIGLFADLDCALQPQINTPEENVCECTYECNSGVDSDVDRGYTGFTTYKYGFQDRIGSANCHCTDDPKAVSCQLNCKTWASDDPSDCTCSESF